MEEGVQLVSKVILSGGPGEAYPAPGFTSFQRVGNG